MSLASIRLSRIARVLLAPALGLALGFSLGACAQGEGDRCERDQDCKAGLRCSKSSGNIAGRCTSGGGFTMDAAAADTPGSTPGPDLGGGVDQPAPADAPGPDFVPSPVDALPEGPTGPQPDVGA